DSRDGVDNSVCANHLLAEQVFQEEWGVALWARAADANRTSKEIAGVAASLADEALTATRTRRSCGRPTLCGAGVSCAHASNRLSACDDGVDNCVVGKRACSIVRVSRVVDRRTVGSHPDHHANPHAWA